MAKNTSKGTRKGTVKDRTQFETPGGDQAKRDAKTGRIIDVKTSDKKPFKGVAQERDDRRKKK